MRKEPLLVRVFLIFVGVLFSVYLVYAFLLTLWQISVISMVFFVFQVYTIGKEEGIWEWELILAAGLNAVIDGVFGKVVASYVSGFGSIIAGGLASILVGILGLVMILSLGEDIKRSIGNAMRGKTN